MSRDIFFGEFRSNTLSKQSLFFCHCQRLLGSFSSGSVFEIYSIMFFSGKLNFCRSKLLQVKQFVSRLLLIKILTILQDTACPHTQKYVIGYQAGPLNFESKAFDQFFNRNFLFRLFNEILIIVRNTAVAARAKQKNRNWIPSRSWKKILFQLFLPIFFQFEL